MSKAAAIVALVMALAASPAHAKGEYYAFCIVTVTAENIAYISTIYSTGTRPARWDDPNILAHFIGAISKKTGQPEIKVRSTLKQSTFFLCGGRLPNGGLTNIDTDRSAIDSARNDNIASERNQGLGLVFIDLPPRF
jgi:hypothetical protein